MTMTPSELRAHVEASGLRHFFDRGTMKFFGDTMKNYGVRWTTIKASFDARGNYHPEGIERKVYELYRKRPVKNGLQSSTYFDPETYARVFEHRDNSPAALRQPIRT